MAKLKDTVGRDCSQLNIEGNFLDLYQRYLVEFGEDLLSRSESEIFRRTLRVLVYQVS